jgi:hypothetical protein
VIIRNLDSNHDFTFGSGTENYIVGNPAIGLNIETRILSWFKDCFFDVNAGIDWANRLGSKNQQALLQLDLRRIILQSFGVTGIVSLNATLVGRIFTVNYTINTIFSVNYQNSVTQDLGI